MENIFKALSDQTRKSIVELLKEKPLSAGEIADKFNISKPSISHHLTILKNCGLVSTNRCGQKIIYELNATVFQELIMWAYSFNSGGDKQQNI